jgi:hypothetical protein
MCINCSQNNNNIFNNDQDGLNGLYGGYSSAWLFDASSLSGSPTTSYFRMNNATLSSVTSIIINKTNKDNIDLSSFITTFNNNGNFGYLRLFKEYDSTTFVDFKITATSVSGNIYTLTVIYVTGNNTFSSNNSTVFSFTPNGNITSNGTVLLGKLIGANMNITTDQLITISGGNTYIITDTLITNSSVNLSSGSIAKGYFYTGTLRSGIEISIANTVPLQSLLSSTYYISTNNAVISIINTQISTVNTVYFSLNSGHGSAATADIYIYGRILN